MTSALVIIEKANVVPIFTLLTVRKKLNKQVQVAMIL